MTFGIVTGYHDFQIFDKKISGQKLAHYCKNVLKQHCNEVNIYDLKSVPKLLVVPDTEVPDENFINSIKKYTDVLIYFTQFLSLIPRTYQELLLKCFGFSETQVNEILGLYILPFTLSRDYVTINYNNNNNDTKKIQSKIIYKMLKKLEFNVISPKQARILKSDISTHNHAVFEEMMTVCNYSNHHKPGHFSTNITLNEFLGIQPHVIQKNFNQIYTQNEKGTISGGSHNNDEDNDKSVGNSNSFPSWTYSDY